MSSGDPDIQEHGSREADMDSRSRGSHESYTSSQSELRPGDAGTGSTEDDDQEQREEMVDEVRSDDT